MFMLVGGLVYLRFRGADVISCWCCCNKSAFFTYSISVLSCGTNNSLDRGLELGRDVELSRARPPEPPSERVCEAAREACVEAVLEPFCEPFLEPLLETLFEACFSMSLDKERRSRLFSGYSPMGTRESSMASRWFGSVCSERTSLMKVSSARV